MQQLGMDYEVKEVMNLRRQLDRFLKFAISKDADSGLKIEQEKDLDDLAQMLVSILPQYVEGPNAQKYFSFWETHGFHLTPVHYYQPIPDTRNLVDNIWAEQSDLVGINMNEHRQLHLLREIFPRFKTEYDRFPAAPTNVPYEFHFNNGTFDGTDALILYCLIRYFQPKKIIEVGITTGEVPEEKKKAFSFMLGVCTGILALFSLSTSEPAISMVSSLLFSRITVLRVFKILAKS